MRQGVFRRMAAMLALMCSFALVAAACGSVGGDSGSDNNNNSSNNENGKEGGSGKGGNKGNEGGGKEKTITIGWINWDEDVVLTQMWKKILEDKGYTVKTTQLQVGALFTGLAKGDLDLFFDAWLPHLHKSYWEKYGSKIDDLGVWYDHASYSLTVPSYVKGVKTISDLKGKGDEFNHQIIGIEAGAGVMAAAQKAVKGYGLGSEYTLKPSSTSSMLQELESSVKDKKPIIVTLWRPHWIYANLKLRDLKDDQGIMGKGDKIHMLSRKGFSSDNPEVTKWMKNFSISDQQLGKLEDIALNKHKEDPAKGVQQWMDKNQDYVKGLTK